jgi:tRNA threonylcarbamoyladenosine biosynthesis protein TsaB
LRVGVVAAKALAYAHQIALVGVNTLEAIAAATALRSRQVSTINVVINAQRDQLFAGWYRLDLNRSEHRQLELGDFEPVLGLIGRLRTEQPNQILYRGQWLRQLRGGDTVTGSGLIPLLNAVQSMPEITIAPEECWAPTAEFVARLGLEYFRRGQVDDPWTLQPYYFRPSAAEEKHAALEKRRDQPNESTRQVSEPDR